MHPLSLSIGFMVGAIVCVFAGPAIRLWVSQVKSELQSEFDKQKIAIEADKNAAIQIWQSENTKLHTTVSELMGELAASEGKLAAFKTLFPSSVLIVAGKPEVLNIPSASGSITT
jgi:hypothetical protein